MRLLTNNPKKLVGLEGYGLEVVERVPIVVEPNPANARYLDDQAAQMGHLLGDEPGKRRRSDGADRAEAEQERRRSDVTERTKVS